MRMSDRLVVGRRSPAVGLALIVALIAGLIAELSASGALAESAFPSRTIEVVVHAKYGGGTDTTARMMMVDTQKALGVDMVVVTKRGGSGVKAHQYALSRPRDGHTILALTQSHLYTIARGKSPLSIDDVVGVARAMEDPTFIAVGAKSPYKSLAELVAASKRKPLVWGVAIIGGTEHIGLVQFAKAAGIRFKAVPFGGGGQMVQSMMTGAVDATVPNVSEAAPRIADGSVRALAVLWPKRVADYPDVPSAYEFGYKVKVGTTRGYWVLKGTPPDRIAKLSRIMVAAMKQDTFVKYLRRSGVDPEESIAGHEAWTRQIREDYEKAAEALKALGLR